MPNASFLKGHKGIFSSVKGNLKGNYLSLLYHFKGIEGTARGHGGNCLRYLLDISGLFKDECSASVVGFWGTQTSLSFSHSYLYELCWGPYHIEQIFTYRSVASHLWGFFYARFWLTDLKLYLLWTGYWWHWFKVILIRAGLKIEETHQ